MSGEPAGTDLEFTGDVWHWRGRRRTTASRVSDEESLDLREVSSAVTCGWGDDPGAGVDRRHRVGDVADPKDGLYVVPLKDAVRRAEGLAEGDTVRVRLRPGVSRRR